MSMPRISRESCTSPLAGREQGAAAFPWDGERLTPKRVVLETVFGCNARCRFCIIDQPTSRRKLVRPGSK